MEQTVVTTEEATPVCCCFELEGDNDQCPVHHPKEGTEPSPVIYGGEILYLDTFKSNLSDDDLPY